MFFFYENYQKKILQNSLEHAYLYILKDDLSNALSIFESIDSPRAKWGIVFIGLIQNSIIKYPTYFELRNFLEIDLDFLLKNKKFKYVENLLKTIDLLTYSNQEIYKYTARTMLENNLINSAKEYLDKSKNTFYNDPELHFIYAKYYLKTFEYSNAYFYLQECLKILPDYFPAKSLLKDIKEHLA